MDNLVAFTCATEIFVKILVIIRNIIRIHVFGYFVEVNGIDNFTAGGLEAYGSIGGDGYGGEGSGDDEFFLPLVGGY